MAQKREITSDENVFEHLQNDINEANAEIRRLTEEHGEEIRLMKEDREEMEAEAHDNMIGLTYLLADRDDRLRDLFAVLCEFDDECSEGRVGGSGGKGATKKWGTVCINASTRMAKRVARILSRDDANIPAGVKHTVDNIVPAWKYDVKVRKQADKEKEREDD